MKINRMTAQEIREALEKASQHCPGSAYEKHLKERLKKLEGEKK